MGGPGSTRVERWAPALWTTTLALLVLGPAMGRGFVLGYDMVWVPDLALGRDALGWGQALPRAVPSDAVVAVLDEVVGGELLQKLVLLLPLVAAGTGAAALAGPGLGARLVACTIAVWNPFVAERLGIGHWPVLVGYGVLPWVILAGTTWRRSGVLPARLPVLLVLGSLSATTGLATAAAVVAASAGRSRGRLLRLLLLVVAANLPWVCAGLLHAGSATSSAAGAVLFAPHGQGLLPGPSSFLVLGGIWNAEVVPASSEGVRGVLLLAVVVGLGGLGAVRGRTSIAPGAWRPLAACWVVGLGSTTGAWAWPEATAWLAVHVPGGGILRDASRLVALAAPATAVLVGRGAAEVIRLLPDDFSRAMAGLGCVLAPLALLPDVALGLSGRLAAVAYPASYAAVADELRSRPAGDVVLLPFQSYRAPGWNDERPVLAPLARYLPRTVVVQDDLVVDGREITGEDPRAARVEAALAAAHPDDRAEALRSAGARLVLVEELPAVEVPQVAGPVVWQGDSLRLVDLGPPDASYVVPLSWRLAMGGAWAAWICVPLLAGAMACRRVARRRR